MEREKILREYLLLTSVRLRHIFERKLPELEKISLREDITTKFRALVDFETRYIIWHDYSSLINYLSSEDTGLRKECWELEQRTSKNSKLIPLSKQEEEKLRELQEQLENERLSKGLIKPEPVNAAEIEFVVKWHINNNLQFYKDNKNLKSTFKILQFDEYKKEFSISIEKKLNPLEFAQEELKRVNNYLETESLALKSIPINLNIPLKNNKITIGDLIYSMTNNNYKIDYVKLYAYIIGGFFKYEELSKSLTPIQYKRFLETWIHNKSNIPNSVDNKNDNVKTGLNLGYSNEKLELLYNNLIALNLLHHSTKLEHFINAFNGEPLASDYMVLKWTKPTIGAICISHLTKNNPRWKYNSNLFEKANYKQLLAQSRGGKIHEEVTAQLKKIIL